MLFRKMSDDAEARLLTLIGLSVSAVIAVAGTVVIVDPFGGRSEDLLRVTIESPFAGEGVEPGTTLIMHGVKVGEVIEVASMADGGVRLETEVERLPTVGLTDTMNIDFRPANYFGVTGLNLEPGQGGSALTDGSLIRAEPTGNFTLQALLERLGEISNGVITPKLIDVVERATNYVDDLDPLIETMLVVADSLANVQTVSTAQLLTNATGISVAFPGFIDAAINTGDLYLHGSLDGATEDFWRNTYAPTVELASTDLFGAAGQLVGSHSEDLAPLTNMIKLLTDVGPGLIPSDEISDTAKELRTRLERLYSGPPDRRAVNVRVILDSLPGVAAPMNALGAVPPAPISVSPELPPPPPLSAEAALPAPPAPEGGSPR